MLRRLRNKLGWFPTPMIVASAIWTLIVGAGVINKATGGGDNPNKTPYCVGMPQRDMSHCNY